MPTRKIVGLWAIWRAGEKVCGLEGLLACTRSLDRSLSSVKAERRQGRAMFDGFKRRRAEKRANDTLKKTRDGIASLSQLNPYLLDNAKASLAAAHAGLVDEFGIYGDWSERTRTAAMARLLEVISAAQRMRDEITLTGSFGANLLIFYYDSSSMPDPQGSEIRRLIEVWAEFVPD